MRTPLSVAAACVVNVERQKRAVYALVARETVALNNGAAISMAPGASHESDAVSGNAREVNA